MAIIASTSEIRTINHDIDQEKGGLNFCMMTYILKCSLKDKEGKDISQY